jgi:hypothetical protein
MPVYVAHVHVQRLVSVVKMATVLKEYTTEEQRSVVSFFFGGGGQKDSMKRIFIMKFFLFTVGKCRRVKWSTTVWQTFL